MDERISQGRLREILHYDPDTGVFTWRDARHSRVRSGQVAGTLHGAGYRLIGIDGRKYRAARLAWLYVYGVWPTYFIDHRNGVRDDDRIANLREATASENQQNAVPRANKTGVIGVSSHGGRYRARITLGRKKKHLGYFDTRELAHQAYLSAKTVLHPFQPVPRS